MQSSAVTMGHWICCILVLWSFGSIASCQCSAQSNVGRGAGMKEDWVDTLMKGSADDDTAVEQRRRVSDSLLQILSGDASRDPATIAAAITIAGEWRISEVVRPLVKKIAFVEGGALPAWRFPSLEEDYIAVTALTQIGRPALPELIARLSQETELLPRYLCLTAIRQIDGDQFSVLYLEDALRKAPNNAPLQLRDSLAALRELIEASTCKR